jgi:glycosyltransferase involved in cell wall biosynthesis
VSPVSPATEQTIRGCDASLHFVFNDVCPNKVLECLASGVHVICSSAGGAKELVAQGGGEVLPVTEGYEAASYPDPSAVKSALERAARDRAVFRKAAREASVRFDLSAWTRAMTGLEKR